MHSRWQFRWLAVGAIALLTLDARGAAPPAPGPAQWLPPRFIGAMPAAGALAFSPDGRTLSGADIHPVNDLVLFEVASLRSRAALPTGPGVRDSFGAAFTPDGRRLVTCEHGKRVRVWDLAQLKASADLPWEPHGGPYSIALSRDGRLLAVVWSDFVALWGVGPPVRRLGKLEARAGAGCRAAFSPDGKTLASGGDDGDSLRLWDVPGRRLRATLRERKHNGGAMAFSPCGRSLATAAMLGLGTDRSVLVREAASGKVVDTWHGHDGTFGLAFTADGRLLVAANNTTRLPGVFTGEVRFWDVAQRRERGEWRIPTAGMAGFAVSPDGSLLAFTDMSERGTTHLYRMPDRVGPAGLRDVGGGSLGPARGGLLAKELDAPWADLAGKDAEKAYRATWALVAKPKEAVAHIRARQRPVPHLDKARLARLIAELGRDSFEARSRATRELELLGDLAGPALRQALEGRADLELRKRAERILSKLGGPLPPGDKLREVRAVEVLELVGTGDARELLRELAGGAPGARLTEEARASLRRLENAAGGSR